MKTLTLHSPGRLAFGILADTINDASSTRKVYLLAGGLAVLGITLLVVTIWFWRSTRPEPALLAPLEIMGERKFRQLDDAAQQELLDSVRPQDAQPLRWGTVHGDPIEEHVIDLEAAARAELIGFDDLRDPVPAVAVSTSVTEDPLLSVIAAAAEAAHESLSAHDGSNGDVVKADGIVDDDDDDNDGDDDDDDNADGAAEPNVWVASDASDASELPEKADAFEVASVFDFEQEAPAKPEPPRRPAPFVRVDSGAAAASTAKAEPPLAHELMDPLLRNLKKGSE
jgi:hypothetical protein